MISASFDDYDIWEETKKVVDKYITVVYIKQTSTGAVISFSKDSVMDFIDCITQAVAKDKGQDVIKHQLEEITKIHDSLTAWEKEFILSVTERVKSRGVVILSGKQLAQIDRIYNEKIIGIQD